MSQNEFRLIKIPDVAESIPLTAGVGGAFLQIVRGFSIWFWLIVGLPTFLAALYFFVIASDVYMSESRFIVRAPGRQAASGILGTLMQSAGMERAPEDAFAVESFIDSRDAVRKLEQGNNLRAVFGRPEGDFLNSFPAWWWGNSFEALYKHYQRFVVVTIDSATGVTTLQVKAFRPQDAIAINAALLHYSEQLVNALNVRAEQDAVSQANREVELTETRLAEIQKNITAYRNHEGILDPKLTSGSIYGALNGAMVARIATQTQLAELERNSPGSPAIPSLRARLAALNAQLSGTMRSVTGENNSVAGKLSGYEKLELSQEIAAKLLASATLSLQTARQDARAKHLYVEHIAEPNLPDYPLFPRRIFYFLITVASSLIVYGIAWLLFASIREHGDA